MSETEDYKPYPDDEPDVDDPRLVEALREYQAALESGTLPDRTAFLARHNEIAPALAECLDGLDFLHSAAPGLQAPAVTAAPPPLPLDGTLGDFRLVRELGRGGMGVVYEAVQISLGRRVALKVLPFAATLDARQLQRFENEARAAAQLHHSNIVPVFAVGVDRAVHFYAMQLIDGLTLAAAVDHLRKTPKPATPTAETIAGAKSLTSQSVSGKTFFRTVAMLAPRRPRHWSMPTRWAWFTATSSRRTCCSTARQRVGDRLRPGPRTLGAEHDRARRPARHAARHEPRTGRGQAGHRPAQRRLFARRHAVRAVDPATGVSGDQPAAMPAADSRRRPSRAAQAEPALPAELETIVLKAMAKLPEDRYASAAAMAADLHRFLEDRPVEARRPGVVDRAAKWARRHRRVVAASVLTMFTGVLVLSATTWRIALAEGQAQTVLAERKKQQDATEEALEREKAAKKEADDALMEAEAQRDLAEGNYREARKMLDYFTNLGVVELGKKEHLANREVQKLRKAALAKLKEYYQDFIDQYGDEPTIVDELIESCCNLPRSSTRWAKKTRPARSPLGPGTTATVSTPASRCRSPA